ncbi:MAG: 2-C-methyl-D-erythritol 4-phosphate cytidylyltransferase [Lachnospiraceae bacterium]|nr:2-C-methyl-D-erythritol 4-phosphate cytidylyltransferase [Lachnospiraceae bacterium]
MIIGAIVAGGSGSRMGTSIPKQFLRLGTKRILLWSVETFLNHPRMDAVIVGVPKEWLAYSAALFDDFVFGDKRRKILLTEGGANRNETLWRITETAIAKLGADADTILVTHDAVRPFVTKEAVTAGIETLSRAGKGFAVTTAIPATDTVLRVHENGEVREVPKRSRMLLAQTPQTVYLGEWRKVYERMTPDERELRTDISGCYIATGLRVLTVAGERGNVKITTPEDYEAALARVSRQGKEKETEYV